MEEKGSPPEGDETEGDEPEEDEEPDPIPHIYMTVRYLAPENAKASVEARQAFYDALRDMARPEYENLARIGRAGGSPSTTTAMDAFSHTLEFFPAWFEWHGLVPEPGFDTSIFANDAIESMVQQAIDGEPFRLRAYPWSYRGDGPSVEVRCTIWHPMIRPSLDGEVSTHTQTWSMTELRNSAVELFRNQLDGWLEAVYDHAKETGVVAKEAFTLKRDMTRLVQKHVLRYSPAEIVALEQGVRPFELEDLDHSDIKYSDKRAVAKSINAAADRLGLELIHLPPGPKPGRRRR